MYIDSDKSTTQIARDVKAQQRKAKRKTTAEDRAKKLAEILGENLDSDVHNVQENMQIEEN